MATFPSSPSPRYSSKRGKQLPALRSESEGSYGMTRRRFTKSRVFFSLNFDNITMAEYTILENFFLANQGTIFDYVYPLDPLNTHKVMFASDTIEATDTSPLRCNTTIELIGV